MKKNSERRLHPRVDTKHRTELSKLKIQRGQEIVAISETKNISLSGMYCKAKEYIFPLTKVEGILQLPVQKKNGPLSLEKVVFQGVIVRITPERKIPRQKEYEVAIFFQGMNLFDQEKIARYMKN